MTITELFRATRPGNNRILHTLHIIHRCAPYEPYVVCWNLSIEGGQQTWDWGTYCATMERAREVFEEKRAAGGFNEAKEVTKWPAPTAT